MAPFVQHLTTPMAHSFQQPRSDHNPTQDHPSRPKQDSSMILISRPAFIATITILSTLLLLSVSALAFLILSRRRQARQQQTQSKPQPKLLNPLSKRFFSSTDPNHKSESTSFAAGRRISHLASELDEKFKSQFSGCIFASPGRNPYLANKKKNKDKSSWRSARSGGANPDTTGIWRSDTTTINSSSIGSIGTISSSNTGSSGSTSTFYDEDEYDAAPAPVVLPAVPQKVLARGEGGLMAVVGKRSVRFDERGLGTLVLKGH